MKRRTSSTGGCGGIDVIETGLSFGFGFARHGWQPFQAFNTSQQSCLQVPLP